MLYNKILCFWVYVSFLFGGTLRSFRSDDLLKILTDFEEVIPRRHKPFPERQVGPDESREYNDHLRKPEHFSDRCDKLLCFLGDSLVHAAHPRLEQHGTNP